MVAEFAVLLLLAAAAVSSSWLLGVRDFWLSLPLGLAAVTSIRVLTFSLVNLIQLRNFANPVFFACLFLVMLFAAWKGTKRLYNSMWLALALAAASAFYTRVLNYTTLPQADSLWILANTRLFDIAGDLSKLNPANSLQRGFAYPLMLALGPQREFLTGFTPLLFGALICAVIWSVNKLLSGYPNHRKWVIGGALGAVLLSAIMPIRAIFYISSENLLAICYLVSATSITLAIRSGQLNRTRLATIAVSLFTASFSAVEAPFFALLIAIPLLIQPWLKRRQIVVLALATFVPYLIWLGLYRSEIITATGLAWWQFATLAVGIAIFLATRNFENNRKSLVWLAPAAMVGFLIFCSYFFSDKMSVGFESLWQNLAFGGGDWGAIPYALLAATVIAAWPSKAARSVEVRALARTAVNLFLGSLVFKIVASSELGTVGLNRFAWSDSLNRIWFELLAVAFVALVTAIGQNQALWKGPNQAN